jgi:hypothetical protein
MLSQGRLKEVKAGELRELYRALPLVSKIKLNIKQRFPVVKRIWRRIRPDF